MNGPFSLAFLRPITFGKLAAVNLPAGVEAVTEEVLGRLHPEEAALARTFKGRRQVEFVGGRLAWRALQPQGDPLGVGPRGEPLAPSGLSVSVAHKRDLALALVGAAADGTLGVDLEVDDRDRSSIAPRVLGLAELEEVARLPEGERWASVLLRFALKEAAYKAIHPHLQRYVGFHEAEVLGGAPPRVTVTTRADEPALLLEGAWEALGGSKILALVRARRA